MEDRMSLEDARKIGYFVSRYVPSDRCKEASETLQYLFPQFRWVIVPSPPVVNVDLA